MNAEDVVTYELEGEIALVGLNRPAKRNCFDADVMENCDAQSSAPAKKPSVASYLVMAIISAPGSTSRGLRRIGRTGRSQRLTFPFNRNTHFELLAHGNIPFIAALDGATLGGGLGNGCGCAYPRRGRNCLLRFAGGNPRHFHRRGRLVRIARLLGFARMQDMMFTGRVLKPDEAERYGVVQYVVPKGQSMAKAKELA